MYSRAGWSDPQPYTRKLPCIHTWLIHSFHRDRGYDNHSRLQRVAHSTDKPLCLCEPGATLVSSSHHFVYVSVRLSTLTFRMNKTARTLFVGGALVVVRRSMHRTLLLRLTLSGRRMRNGRIAPRGVGQRTTFSEIRVKTDVNLARW